MRVTGRFQVSITCHSISHLFTIPRSFKMGTISIVGMILAIALHLCPVHPRPTQVAAPRHCIPLYLHNLNVTQPPAQNGQQMTEPTPHDCDKTVYYIPHSHMRLDIFSDPSTTLRHSDTILCLEGARVYAHAHRRGAPLRQIFRYPPGGRVQFGISPAVYADDFTWDDVAIIANALLEYFHSSGQWHDSTILIEDALRGGIGSCSVWIMEWRQMLAQWWSW